MCCVKLKHSNQICTVKINVFRLNVKSEQLTKRKKPIRL